MHLCCFTRRLTTVRGLAYAFMLFYHGLTTVRGLAVKVWLITGWILIFWFFVRIVSAHVFRLICLTDKSYVAFGIAIAYP